MITIDDVRFSFGDRPVLDGISLQVEGGELVGLIGPNGAGKTTLLRLISAALTPDAGDIFVDGTAVHSLSSRAASRRVAVVPQETRLSFDFTVNDVVAMGRNPYLSRFDRLSGEDRRIVDRAMVLTETQQFADRPFSSISGGERKRVLVARAIAQEAPNLLLDEPTASLDINHQIGLFELSRRLIEDGKAVLAAVHDLDMAARFCDRLILLNGGRVEAEGSPSTVLRPDRLEAAYGIETAVVVSPVTGTPVVVPGVFGHGQEMEALEKDFYRTTN